jgi:hypothetical protein
LARFSYYAIMSVQKVPDMDWDWCWLLRGCRWKGLQGAFEVGRRTPSSRSTWSRSFGSWLSRLSRELTAGAGSGDELGRERVIVLRVAHVGGFPAVGTAISVFRAGLNSRRSRSQKLGTEELVQRSLPNLGSRPFLLGATFRRSWRRRPEELTSTRRRFRILDHLVHRGLYSLRDSCLP